MNEETTFLPYFLSLVNGIPTMIHIFFHSFIQQVFKTYKRSEEGMKRKVIITLNLMS